MSEAFTVAPLPDVDGTKQLDARFGRVVVGMSAREAAALDPSSAEAEALRRLLFTHSLLLFKGGFVPPQDQLAVTRLFDPTAPGVYGHESNHNKHQQSVLHPDLKTCPSVPQVQVIGNGFVAEHEGLKDITLRHPHHKTFHRDPVSQEDEDRGITRFYRWHIDSALYDLCTPIATTLQAVSVPKGPKQVARYDDGSGDEVSVPLGGTTFISGAKAFDILPPHLKSLAVRTKIKYAPHPYVWMSSAKARPDGLGMYSEGKELPLTDLPPWTEEKIKLLPMTWKNPATCNLHLQVHPSAIMEIHVEPVPADAAFTSEDIFPAGTIITDLGEAREFVRRLQRPAIAPEYVYAHDWEEGDFVIFHNRGVLHSVVGAFKPDQVRIFHQCNLASSTDPVGPSTEDVTTFC
ncbi:Clavaminate synthase-like protein [Chytriomyces sp. MP71]|nr:Clavaminate synthase-like protein [Chytriomyces sp. MP71]